MPPSLETSLGAPTVSAVAFFLLIVALTFAVTWWAARRTKSTSEFFAAGRSIKAFENGLALAGDYMSAASFLGIAGLVALRGYDGMIYATGWLVGWPALMFLLAEPVRNLGKYTFADVVAFRLRQVPVRIASAFGGILTVLFYTIAQMVGAGNLIRLLFGIPYEWAVVGVGLVMLAYVLFGGMIATTWVQIIKAVLLLFGVTLLTALVLVQFDFSPARLYAAVAERYGPGALEPGGLVTDPLDAISLGLALMLGLLGLPHILMRFYTVPDARAARVSVLYATGFIGYFYLIIPIVGSRRPGPHRED
jgi:cation/acetate symporter